VKKQTLVILILILFVTIFKINNANAVSCQEIKLKEVFFEEYYEDFLWKKTDGVREIKWSMPDNYINKEKVIRQFSEIEKQWVRESFKSIDDVLDSFKFIENNNNPDIVIGYTALKNSSGWWTVEGVKPYRERGYIQLRYDIDWWFGYKDRFIQTVQQELGNIMGAGDIKPSDKIISIFEDPAEKPYGNIPLLDFDKQVLKQLYKEDYCPKPRFDYPQTYLIVGI
jgi:hypothetical protein